MLGGHVKKPARPAKALARLAVMKCTRCVRPSWRTARRLRAVRAQRMGFVDNDHAAVCAPPRRLSPRSGHSAPVVL